MDATDFLRQFHDHVAPRLDTYEQAVYLYLVRHTRLEGESAGVFGFKSARIRMACGIGTKGSAMSEHTAYEKLRSLAAHGLIVIQESTRKGSLVKVLLPGEIGWVRACAEVSEAEVPLEAQDFFGDELNRGRIVRREKGLCFYCLRKLRPDTMVIEHVVSRPLGDSSYRNVVAACRACNNKKNDGRAADHLRLLLRDGILSDADFAGRLSALGLLRNGELVPPE